nr:MAG TPA: zinc ribbon domain protein [Caudoviricetes sp.]
MREIRCPHCGKLLGKIEGKGEIKCPRCHKLKEFNTELERQERQER